MLSGSITLHRRSKDGVGISNVDVVFALGDSDYIAPSDGAGWKTLFSELTLTAGKYVWSCTKVTKTDRSVEYTGKYCMGYATDFTDVIEQYALSSSGTTAPTSGWDTAYQPKKGMYLWTRNAYNWKNSSITYSTPRCVNYFPNDGVNGTSFTPMGTALGHYSSFSSLNSSVKNPNSGDKYILDSCTDGGGKVNGSRSVPCVLTYMNAPDYDWYIDTSDEGDAYRVGTNLWVNNGTKWVDFGDIQGPAGEDGHNLTLMVSPSKFILDVDKDMQISNGGHIHFYCYGLFGGTAILKGTEGASFTVSCPSGCNFNINQVGLFENGDTTTCYFNTDGIERKTYTVANKTKTAPCSSAYFEVTLTYKGFSVTQRVDIVCNMTICEMDQIMTNEEFQRTYEAKVAEQGQLIAANTSQITQTASEVSSKVSKTEYDANNKAISLRCSIIEQDADRLSLEVKQFKEEVGDMESDIYADLYDTGIDITTCKIQATANNFVVRNNKGEDTMTIDAEGNLVTGNIIVNGGQIGSFNITKYSDSTGFNFYGLSARSDGSTAIAPTSLLLDYQGISVGSGYSYLGCTAKIGEASKVGNEFCWMDGMVHVEGDFSSSDTGNEQASFCSTMRGNGKNRIAGYTADAQGGAQNYAFYAKHGDVYTEAGSVKSNQFCGGVGLSVLNLSSSKQYYNNSELDVSQNGTWLIYASQNQYNVVALPKLSAVRKFLGNASKFCLRLTIIGKRNSQTFYIRGRNDSNDNLKGSEYPYYLDNNGYNGNEPGMAGGDILELALVYDGSDYSCYCLNLRN